MTPLQEGDGVTILHPVTQELLEVEVTAVRLHGVSVIDENGDAYFVRYSYVQD